MSHHTELESIRKQMMNKYSDWIASCAQKVMPAEIFELAKDPNRQRLATEFCAENKIRIVIHPEYHSFMLGDVEISRFKLEFTSPTPSPAVPPV